MLYKSFRLCLFSKAITILSIESSQHSTASICITYNLLSKRFTDSIHHKTASMFIVFLFFILARKYLIQIQHSSVINLQGKAMFQVFMSPSSIWLEFWHKFNKREKFNRNLVQNSQVYKC